MAKDMDSVAKSPAVGKDGKPIIKDGKQLTNQEAYQAGLELGDTVNKAGDTINYGTRQDLWGSGGTGNRIATALIGAYSGNVSNGASTLLQNTALNVVRTYGATEIKHLADGFSTETDDKGNPIPNATSETVRGLLHAVAGCAGASATGGDCASAGLASAGTVAMNNAMTALLNLNPNDMTDTQKQAYSNLIGTLVAGVSTAVGGDAAAAQLASKVEVDDNYLNPTQRTWSFDVVNNQLAQMQGHNLTKEQYEAQLLKLTPTSEQMNQKMIADCLGGKASCDKEKSDAQGYINWIKAMEAQGKLTPGKFGNGTLEALAQVATVTYNSPVAHQTATPTDVGVLGALMPAHLQGVAANSQVSQALGYQNSMNDIGYTGAIVAGYAPYVVTGGLVIGTNPATSGSLGWSALTGGAGSVALYAGLNKENSTPAGVATSFVTGAFTGGFGYQMSVWGSLPQTIIPTTVGGAVIKANSATIGATAGQVRDTTTDLGNSWWTRPIINDDKDEDKK